MKRAILPIIFLALLLAACPTPKPTPTPTPTPIPTPTPPVPPVPPLPVIPVCSIPYHATGKLLIVADACLTLFCTKDSDTFKAADIPDYLDAVTIDGDNAVRGVIQSDDATPGKWESWHWGDAGYEDHLRAILAAVKARDMTAIVCVTPYGGASYSDAQYNQILAVLKDYQQNVIIEAINEPTDMGLAAHVVDLALAAGFTPQYIQVEFYDGSDYYNELIGPLQSKAPTCLHFCASMDDINAPWPAGWVTSGGMMQFVSLLGLYPSSDGGTHGHNGQFPFPEWAAHPEAHASSATDCHDVTKWNILNGGRGFEWLSPASFPTPYPNIRAAIDAGRACRVAMRAGYNEAMSTAKASKVGISTGGPTFPLIPGAKRTWRGR